MNDRIMTVRVNVGKRVIKLVSVYAPQVGRPMDEKEGFYLALGKTLQNAGDRNGEMVAVCGDFNGHVGEEIEGYEGVHGGKGFGKRNLEGEMLLEFADAHQLSVMKTWFEKSEQQKISYDSLSLSLSKRFKSVLPVDNKIQSSRVCTCRMRLTYLQKDG